MSTSKPSGDLLGDVRVLDFTRVLAGPFCTRMMADMGAEIIKVEPPGGDISRQFEFITPEGVSGYFMQQNCGKKDICLDLSSENSKTIIYKLIEISDVVVENYRPGVMTRLGLSYETMRSINPSIILCSLSAFGQESPYAKRPAGDMVIQSMSGVASLTGDPEGPPQTVGMSLSDTTGGLHAFGAICASLYRRSKTGTGEHIDISLLDCVFSQNEWASQHLILSKGQIIPTRYGNRRPILIPGNLFKGRDGWVAIVASTDPGWENLCSAMGMPRLSKDPRFSNRSSRIEHRDELEGIVEEWVGSFESIHEVESLLADRGGVQCGRVQTWKEMLESDHVLTRHLITEVEDPTLGPTPVLNTPFTFSGGSPYVRGPAPLLGEHTLEILQQLLGYENEKILDLINTNVLHADDDVMVNLVQILLKRCT